MIKNNKNTLLRFLPTIIWMAVIFYLSHQPADISKELSSGVISGMVLVLERMITFVPFFETELLHHLIRKGAHFFAYFLLGIFVFYAIRGSSGKRTILTLLICILYAISDEVHQLFIPGRSGEFRDVLIDSAGTLAGVGVYLFISRIKTK